MGEYDNRIVGPSYGDTKADPVAEIDRQFFNGQWHVVFVMLSSIHRFASGTKLYPDAPPQILPSRNGVGDNEYNALITDNEYLRVALASTKLELDLLKAEHQKLITQALDLQEQFERECKCGSHAINEHMHGRVIGKHPDLCDVCYFKAERDDLLAILKSVMMTAVVQDKLYSSYKVGRKLTKDDKALMSAIDKIESEMLHG